MKLKNDYPRCPCGHPLYRKWVKDGKVKRIEILDECPRCREKEKKWK